MKRLFAALLVAIFAGHALAQTPKNLSFEVVSIKPLEGRPSGGFRTLPGGRFTGIVDVSQLLSAAYPGIRAALGDIIGPDWIFRERFDIVASAGREATREEMNVMVRTLLEDRFKLRAHMERQDQPTWELVVARADGVLGPDLKPYKGVCGRDVIPPCGVSASREAVRGVGVPIERIATFFTSSVEGRRVFDKTGLAGSYDFTLVYRPPDVTPRDPNDNRPTLFTALQEQLGLKLIAARGVVEVLIVDHIERPSEN